jgi:hemoglobin
MEVFMTHGKIWLIGFVCAFLAACASTQPSSGGASLYDRLGGKGAIVAVVDDMVANIAADNRVNMFFAHADPVRLKGHLVDQVCAASGGPCKYTGRDMQTAHKDMAITDAHFNAVVESLVKSLDKHNVGAAEKSELLGLLAPMKSAIVNTR